MTVIQNDLSQRIPFILGDLFDQDIDDDDESAHQMVKKVSPKLVYIFKITFDLIQPYSLFSDWQVNTKNQ